MNKLILFLVSLFSLSVSSLATVLPGQGLHCGLDSQGIPSFTVELEEETPRSVIANYWTDSLAFHDFLSTTIVSYQEKGCRYCADLIASYRYPENNDPTYIRLITYKTEGEFYGESYIAPSAAGPWSSSQSGVACTFAK